MPIRFPFFTSAKARSGTLRVISSRCLESSGSARGATRRGKMIPRVLNRLEAQEDPGDWTLFTEGGFSALSCQSAPNSPGRRAKISLMTKPFQLLYCISYVIYFKCVYMYLLQSCNMYQHTFRHCTSPAYTSGNWQLRPAFNLQMIEVTQVWVLTENRAFSRYKSAPLKQVK